jgi:translation initiation factor 1
MIEKSMAGERSTRLVYSTGGESEAAPQKTPSAPESRSPGVRLRLDRRASSRVVTVVTGLPPGQADALTRALKAACGAGGTYKDGALELQGDHRDRVEEELRARGLRSKRAGG